MSRPASGILSAILCCFFTSVFASETRFAESLIATSGIDSHLRAFQPVVLEESSALSARCASEDLYSRKSKLQHEVLLPATLVQEVTEEFSSQLSHRDKSLLVDWFQSPLGIKIRQVEKRFANVSAEEYKNQYDQYLESGILDKDRFKVVRQLNRHLMVAEFVTAINSEISVASALMGECDDGAAGLTRADAAISDARADLKFVSFLMRPDLDAESAFLYASLSNVELGVYLDFATSDLGKRYHQALVSATANTLTTQNNQLRSILFAEVAE